MQARRSRSEWSSIIREYERLGGAQEAFCSKRGLKLGSFRGWLYRLRKTGPRAEVALVPVAVRESPTVTAPSLKLQGADVRVAVAGVELSFPVGTAVDYVASLVRELRSRC